MNSRFLIFLLIFFSIYSLCYPQNTGTDENLRRVIRESGQADVEIPYLGGISLDRLSREVSILNVSDKTIKIRLSQINAEWFIVQNFDYIIPEKRVPKGLISALSAAEVLEWDKYPTYTQYDSIMRSFQALYPALCRLDTIGISLNGKLVLVLKISDNAAIDETEPEVFYSSTIHGDETGGFVLMLRLADYLLKNYQSDLRVKNLVDNLEIWLNPLANPDGTYISGNLIINPVRFNANGYDLNRNFPDPFTPNTVKQKETLDMMKFMRERRFILSANFHSGVEVVNYPWDRWLSKYHADDIWFHNISRTYADTVHKYSGPAYMDYLDNGITRGAVWYVIYGGRQDFTTYELQGREVTIELDDQYITPAAQLPLLWEYNRHSLILYLENALYGIHGKVIDAVSSDPVAAKIFIQGHDKDSSHIYSDTLSGSFSRLLSPQSWDLTFSAAGYLDTTISNITVFDLQKTLLEVKMVPVTNGIDTTDPGGLVLYPNPVRELLKAVLPENISGPLNIRLYNHKGMLIRDYDEEAFYGVPVLIRTSGLAAGGYSVVFRNRNTNLSVSGRLIVVK